MTVRSGTSRSSGDLFWLALFFSAAAVTAVSAGSFWIDEFATTHFASQPSLSACWGEMVRMRFPELQAPLYMAYIWSWVHLFGTGEWGMRFAGVPWFVGGAVAFATIVGRALRCTPVVAVITGFSAFAWYYLNEARVYSFQLGFALAAVAAAFELTRTASVSTGTVRLFALALVGLCGSSVLGAFAGFFLFLGVLALVSPRRWISFLMAAPIASATAAILLVGFAAYYGWTLTVHTKATAVSTTTLHSVAFAVYEIFGAGGFGPARYALREHGISALSVFLGPLLIFFILCAYIVVEGLIHATRVAGSRRVAIAVAAALVPVLVLITIGVTTRFRLVGRHVAAVAPLALLLLTTGSVAALRSPGWRRLLVSVFLVLWTLSALSIRFAPWHHKDEYRGALALARAAALSGRTVWWNADPGGVAYYGNLAANPDLARRLVPLMNPRPSDLSTLPAPSFIVVSKPDAYDSFGAVAAFLRDRQFSKVGALPAFSFFAPPSMPDRPPSEK